MCEQKSSDGAFFQHKVACPGCPMTKIQPEMRSQELVKLSTISYGSTALKPRPAFLPILRMLSGIVEYDAARGLLLVERWQERNRRASDDLQAYQRDRQTREATHFLCPIHLRICDALPLAYVAA